MPLSRRILFLALKAFLIPVVPGALLYGGFVYLAGWQSSKVALFIFLILLFAGVAVSAAIVLANRPQSKSKRN
jgi:hypothetical protein